MVPRPPNPTTATTISLALASTLSLPAAFAAAAAAEDGHLKFTRRLAGCGRQHDLECPLHYSLGLINQSAAEHTVFDPVLHQAAVVDQNAARGKCEGGSIFLGNGGWCLLGGHEVHLGNNQSYDLPPTHVIADRGILKYVISLVDKDPEVTINDFGAGVGQYGHELLAVRPKAKYLGYDGAGNVEDYTKGFLQWFDLTKPLALPKADWVMSLEVGEHVPHEFEHMVIRNLHAHNTIGVIVSWARVNQGGHGHVNNHSSDYLVKLFKALGYDYDEATSVALRAKADYAWFRKTTHVFRRRVGRG